MIERDHHRRPGERGAVLVEFVIVATVLVTLVLGVFEIGMMWSDHQALTQSARHGARVVSQLGVAGEADVEALRSVNASLSSINANIDRVVVFEADTNGDMPTACETASAGYTGSANCNVYDSTSIANLGTLSWWGSGLSCGSADSNWCSATHRNDTQASATYIGVHVEITRPYLTSFFGGGTQTMSETTVMRIEPAD
jgi:Flp pilus assembly protein TadG